MATEVFLDQIWLSIFFVVSLFFEKNKLWNEWLEVLKSKLPLPSLFYDSNFQSNIPVYCVEDVRLIKCSR